MAIGLVIWADLYEFSPILAERIPFLVGGVFFRLCLAVDNPTMLYLLDGLIIVRRRQFTDNITSMIYYLLSKIEVYHCGVGCHTPPI